jgi:hypothetical protein
MAGLSSQSAKDSERARLEQELAEAENYTEWCKIAIQLDEVIGMLQVIPYCDFELCPKVVNSFLAPIAEM